MNPTRRKILVIQTDFDDGVHSAQLVASAKYVFMLVWKQHREPILTTSVESLLCKCHETQKLTRKFSSFHQMTIK